MKKFIRDIIIFTCLSGGVYIAMLLILGRSFVGSEFRPNLSIDNHDAGFTGIRLSQYQQIDSVDILFLGSSHAYRGFDTRIFEEKDYSSFNLGTSSQSHLQTHTLLRQRIDDIHPQLVIYEVYPTLFGSDGIESSLDIILHGPIDENTLLLALENNHLKVYNTLLFKIFDVFNPQRFTPSLSTENKKDKYIKNGFVEYTGENRLFSSEEAVNYSINQQQVEYFEKNLAILKAKNIPYLLVYAPVSSSYYRKLESVMPFDPWIEGFGPYYNFNHFQELGDSTLYYDKDHLNQKGVKKFNHRLLDLLNHRDSILKNTY